MRLRYLKRAERQLRELLAWLNENGDLPSFRAALARKTQLLKATPFAGAPVTDTRMPGVRVAYLETSHILYYRVNEKDGFVEVLRVWHTSRGRRPKL